MSEQNASYLVKHSEIGSKKFKQNLPENYSKSTKVTITACQFSNYLWGSMPTDPQKLFVSLKLNQLQICSAEKNTLEKNVEIMAPLSFKIFRYATAFLFVYCMFLHVCMCLFIACFCNATLFNE